MFFINFGWVFLLLVVWWGLFACVSFDLIEVVFSLCCELFGLCSFSLWLLWFGGFPTCYFVYSLAGFVFGCFGFTVLPWLILDFVFDLVV